MDRPTPPQAGGEGWACDTRQVPGGEARAEDDRPVVEGVESKAAPARAARGLRARQDRERAQRRCGLLRRQGEGSTDAVLESERGPEMLACAEGAGKAARTAQ